MLLRTNAILISIGLYGFLLLGVRLSAYGQTTIGTIRGLITDPTGKPIPNASVIVEEQDTGATIKTKTSTNGQYVVPLLQPGVFTILVEAGGFAPSQRTDVSLNIQQTLQVDFRLVLGEITQRVTLALSPVENLGFSFAFETNFSSGNSLHPADSQRQSTHFAIDLEREPERRAELGAGRAPAAAGAETFDDRE